MCGAIFRFWKIVYTAKGIICRGLTIGQFSCVRPLPAPISARWLSLEINFISALFQISCEGGERYINKSWGVENLRSWGGKGEQNCEAKKLFHNFQLSQSFSVFSITFSWVEWTAIYYIFLMLPALFKYDYYYYLLPYQVYTGLSLPSLWTLRNEKLENSTHLDLLFYLCSTKTWKDVLCCPL